ncbi:hypothetical protein Ava_D0033 [Trichormus variabilis ATCC 29413]|uniref:FtsK domain-containing protein n=2 Tax=Anabaena variabilis TaxID=264691 RepID=Q3M2T8_TRIV2|nr:hypothetical protein [Trichormus variabilis]ABA24698.1 hypothetical protein Ava_D0033 [Trichormus variabilis ATCC 29413]MBC1217737.1 hypothetical protein [Trichormus variabilis ARAD]MBC1258972.1 hypothetical protein [Trichormus variabilis V5]MBC1302683.1 hypothetical protein [Trichormus variabilis N2B]MBC1324538.1 hypothetical protein [Trichormus variabilis 9RC]
MAQVRRDTNRGTGVWSGVVQIAAAHTLIIVGLYEPSVLLPTTAIGFFISSWVLGKFPNPLPRKNELIAAAHRENWRTSALTEVEKSAQSRLEEIEQKAGVLVEMRSQLQTKSTQLAQWEQNLLQAEGKFRELLQQTEDHYKELLQQQAEQYMAEIRLREGTIVGLQQKIMRMANRPDPKQGFAAWVAQMLLDALEQNQVYCRMVAFQKVPGVREVSVWVELEPIAVEPGYARKLEGLSKEVASLVKLGEPAIQWDEDECIWEFRFAPRYETEESLLANVIDDPKELPAVIEPDDPDWFRRAIRVSFSCLIHGGMGAGKSVLVSNLICCANQELEQVYSLAPELVIIDPKFPDSEWIIAGKRIKPNYRGWENSITGVADMGQEVDRRLDEAKAIAEEIDEELFADPNYVLPLPERTPTIWVIDEAAALHERYGNEFSEPLKNAFWVGRSTRNVAIAIGQNPNCSNYGLQRPDAENASRFFLGAAMALKGLDELKTTRELKTKLRQQIYARLALVRQRKLQGIDKPEEQYFGLVAIQNEMPFIAQMPPPNAFAFDGEVELREGEEIETIENLIEQADWEETLRALPEELRIVAEYAKRKRGDWVTARDIKRDRNRGKISTASTEEVRQWFTRLAAMGIGEVTGGGTALKYKLG